MESTSSSIPDLLVQARWIIRTHSLDIIEGLGIGSIQNDLEEAEKKIAETRTRRFTDVEESKFTHLRDFTGRFDNYVVKHLNAVQKVSGIQPLLDCYMTIQGQYRKDLIEIQKVFNNRVTNSPTPLPPSPTALQGLSTTQSNPSTLAPLPRIVSPEYERAFENLKAHLRDLANPVVARDLTSCFEKISQRSVDGRAGILPHFSALSLPKDIRLQLEEFDRQMRSACRTDSVSKLGDILEILNHDIVMLSKPVSGVELWPELKDLLSLDEIKKLDNDVTKEVLHLIKAAGTDQLRDYMKDALKKAGVDTETFDNLLESIGKYDLNTVLAEVIEKRPAETSGIVSHWNKPAAFFLGKTLIFGDTTQFGNPSGQIVDYWREGDNSSYFLLDTDFIIGVTHSGANYVVQVKKQLNDRLFNLLNEWPHDLNALNFKLTQSSNNTVKGMIPEGSYQFQFDADQAVPGVIATLHNIQTMENFLIALEPDSFMTNGGYVVYLNNKTGNLNRIEKRSREDFRKTYLIKKEKSAPPLLVDASKCDRLMLIKEDINEARLKIAQQKTINGVIDVIRASLLGYEHLPLLYQLSDNLIAHRLETIDVSLDILPPHIRNRLEEVSDLYTQYFQSTRPPLDVLKQVVLEAIYAQEEIKKNGINIANTMALLQQADLQAERLKGRDGVLFMGETGSGKSTSIAYLSGAKMDQIKNQVGDTVFVLAPTNDNSEYPSIGQSLGMSETLYAQGYEPKDKVRAQGAILIDCAGSHDTRGTEWELCANLSVDEAVNQLREIRALVAVCPFSAIKDDRANKIIDLILTIQERFPFAFVPDRPESSCIHLIITKVPKTGSEDENFGTRIVTYIREIDKLLEEYSKTEQDGHTKRSLEGKKRFWQALQQMHTNKQIHLIDVLNRKVGGELLAKICRSTYNGLKASYNSSVDTYSLRKKFGDIIEQSTETWVHIFNEYQYKVPRLIQEKQNDLTFKRQRLKELDQEKIQRSDKILQYGQQIARLESFIIDLKAARDNPLQMSEELYVLLEVKEKVACQNELELSLQDLKACEEKAGIISYNMNALNSVIGSMETELHEVESSFAALVKEVRRLSTGHEEVSLLDFYVPPSGELLLFNVAQEDKNSAFAEIKEYADDQMKDKKTTNMDEYEGDLEFNAIIDGNIRLVPIDPKLREEFSRIFKTSGTVGTYEAKLEGEKFSIDLGFNADFTGKKVVYSLKTHWVRGQTYPWVKITHTIPSSEFHEATIVDIAAQIERQGGELLRLRTELGGVEPRNGKKGERAILEEDLAKNANRIHQLKEKINSLQEKLTNETGRISTRIGTLLKEQEQHLGTKREEKAALEQSREIEEKTVTVNGELAELQKTLEMHLRKKRNLAIIVKSKWEVVRLLRKFASLALSGSKSVQEPGERGSGILTVCKAFVDVYDACKETILDKCQEDLKL